MTFASQARRRSGTGVEGLGVRPEHGKALAELRQADGHRNSGAGGAGSG